MPLRRFPRTIRFDATDERVFERAAAPDEWAASGAFAFADADPQALTGKARQAFRNGFLGLASFGRSTFVAVAEIPDEAFEEVVQGLARHLVARWGAPSMDAALAAAREEADFAVALCAHPVNTILAVEREFGTDGIVERFRTIEMTGERPHARIWTLAEGDDG